MSSVFDFLLLWTQLELEYFGTQGAAARTLTTSAHMSLDRRRHCRSELSKELIEKASTLSPYHIGKAASCHVANCVGSPLPATRTLNAL